MHPLKHVLRQCQSDLCITSCAGLYAPTSEEHCDEDLYISGSMPPSVSGVYVRVGPNPYFEPTGNYHWFDGEKASS